MELFNLLKCKSLLDIKATDSESETDSETDFIGTEK
jgi:hypothetical protein